MLTGYGCAWRFRSIQCINIKADVVITFIPWIDVVQSHFEAFVDAMPVDFLLCVGEANGKYGEFKRLGSIELMENGKKNHVFRASRMPSL